ncbi:MAG: sigma-54 dependent transcriptional regulator [Candidatus Latescibacteria bacterium]|jgi:DNA-binding NtrC family response regulator|nr:sigma-54 dependent transcriptional regulator [Candidatus Latescibacterota bacterium]
MAQVLIVEDDLMFQKVLYRGLEMVGHDPIIADEGLYGLEQLVRVRPDVVLLDLRLKEGGLNGLEVLARIRDLHPQLPVIIMTGYGTVENAVEAMKRGASDFIQKPFGIEEALLAVEHVLDVARLRQEVGYLRQVQAAMVRKEPPVAVSRAMREVLDIARKTAQSSASVLLCGESGSGKDLLARFIHNESPRNPCPFVVVECASLAADRVASELFGRDDEMGKFQLADGGTLLLDEIGTISAEGQAKLLRVLEDGVVPHRNRKAAFAIDVRVIATMSMELDEAMVSGRLRGDLFHRLNQVSLRLPPLRERPEDILPLFEDFLREFLGSAKSYRLEPAARDLLLQHTWPGNVRELRNMVERIALLGDGKCIGPEQLVFTFANMHAAHAVAPGADVGMLMDSLGHGEVFDGVVRLLLEESLARSGGNQAEASRFLGLNRSRFAYRLKQYGINPQDFQDGT